MTSSNGSSNGSSIAPRIALIGCGAFAQVFYLPAFAKNDDARARLVLVDKDAERVGRLAAGFGVARYATDYRQVLGKVDGAIVAVGHHLHYPISMDFLRAGAHVLCEKPLAGSVDEAEAMIAQANASGVALATNYTQRLFPSSRKVKELLGDGTIGRLRSIRYSWGGEFNWPTASGFYFKSGSAPRGVLLDRGPHPIDLIAYWLDARPRLVSFQTDSYGGPEAEAHLQLEHEGCVIDVRLSWLTDLPNRYTIEGDRATIENGFEDWWVVPITLPDGSRHKLRLRSDVKDYFEFGVRIVANFLDVVRAARPLVPADVVLPSVSIIEEAYRRATRFPMPWDETFEVAHVR